MLGFPTALRMGLAAVCLTLYGCGSGSSLGATVSPMQALHPAQRLHPAAPDWIARSTSGGAIKHIVFIIQENRSFNNLFMGYPGATTTYTGVDQNGDQIAIQAEPFNITWDIEHNWSDFTAAYDDGKMDGWNNEVACCGQPANFAYSYVNYALTQPYWDMAKQYVLADQMFQSNIDGSFVAHQYAIAAYAGESVDSPTTAWGCQGGSKDVVDTLAAPERVLGPTVAPCFGYQTLGDELDAAGLTWRFYASPVGGKKNLWSAYEAVAHIYEGPDWKNVITPSKQFLTDVAAGTLDAVTWITPTWKNSDHSGSGSDSGPSWVSSLVDAVGESPFWNSTAIVIIWDDWGGWYDEVAPNQVDYDGLGFRIPMLIVSPYAKRGYVTHVQYETASVPRFIEDNFGLAQLAAADARAADPAADSFDFKKAPRPFRKIHAHYSTADILAQPPDYHAPDDQ
jgi:phospholipase C